MSTPLKPENVIIPEINDDLRNGTFPITQGSKPDVFLRHRGINLKRYPPDLRMDANQNMVAAVRDPLYGIVVGYQTTVIRNNGTHYRKFASGLSIPDGSAVRMGRAERVMGVAEGIETALSAFDLSTIPTWATLGSSRLEKWIAPRGVEAVYIFADNDKHGQGEKSASILEERLNARGIKTEIIMPKHLGDWNDFVQNRIVSKNIKSQTPEMVM